MFPRAPDCQTTIHHWQLRDLVAAGDSSEEFLAVCGDSVLLHNVTSGEVSAAAVKGGGGRWPGGASRSAAAGVRGGARTSPRNARPGLRPGRILGKGYGRTCLWCGRPCSGGGGPRAKDGPLQALRR